MPNKLELKHLRALVIDMDGVLWLGDTPLPGLVEFFDFLRRHAIRFMLATNNATKTPEQFQRKLAGFGVTVAREEVLTSSLAAAAYMAREFKRGANVYVVGQAGLVEAVREAGFTLVEDSRRPADAVVAGLDQTLTYEKLKHAALLIRGGARFIGTNGDLTLPTDEGFLPGAGAVLAAIEAATGQAPLIIGKPEPFMFEVAMAKMGSRPEETATLGDRLETDILGGQQAGLRTILVTCGVDNEASVVTKGIRPELIFSGIEEITRLWQAQI